MYNIKLKNKILQRKGSVYLNDEPKVNALFPVKQVSELEKTVYSVNHLTGLPDSDISIMTDTNVSPVLRQAIQNSSQVYTPNAPSSFDADAILDNVQRPLETKAEYYDRLKENADSLNDTEESE